MYATDFMFGPDLTYFSILGRHRLSEQNPQRAKFGKFLKQINTLSKERIDREMALVISLWGNSDENKMEACKHFILTTQKYPFLPGFKLHANRAATLNILCIIYVCRYTCIQHINSFG